VAVPVIVPRADHPISRRNIDSEALRVLYRLHENRHTAYLVGGSVRDLILGRRPKDFDIGTDAHPYQIKRLFRNCWIIGRRFRLAHIKFGPKTIEVATFRKTVPDLPPDPSPDESVIVSSAGPAPGDQVAGDAAASAVDVSSADNGVEPSPAGGIIHRDNTFGTPEEDAFRRDFTINALFYDVGTFSVIDYVGGLDDLRARVIRSIGDPRVRFVEDPVRMLRAAVFGARLGFDLDPEVIEAIAMHRTLIQKASPARLMEEYFKILRSGYAEASFHALRRLRLLELITPELKSPPDAVWDSLARLDAYRQKFPEPPPTLSTTVLIGALLMPLGALTRRTLPAAGADADPRHDRVSFGMLPVPRKDIERLRQLAQTTPRLVESDLPPRVVRSLVHRPAFDDALAWLEVFGDDADLIARWTLARSERAPSQPRPPHPHHQHHRQRGARPTDAAATLAPHEHQPDDPDSIGNRAPDAPRRRRRRRRRRRPAPPG
jgi:poly(A) polymerase